MTSFKDTYPFSAFGGKIDPISEIRNAGIVTSGNVYWVKDPSDADYIPFKESVGKENLFDTIQPAINKCTNDQNDYVMVCPKAGGSAWELAAAVDMNKSRVHLVSVGYNRGLHGYTNTIQGYAGATIMDNEVVHVTQEGCEIAGFRMLATAGTGAGGTLTNGILYLSGSAHNLYVHDCGIETIGTDWDDAKPVSVVNAAASQHGARFDNCLIGGTVAEGSGTQQPVTCAPSGQRWEFHNTKFLVDSGDTGRIFVTAGTGKIDYTLFDNCSFIDIDQGNSVASAIAGNITDDQGMALVQNCHGYNLDAFGTDDNCWVTGQQSGTAEAGIHDPGIGAIGSAGVPAA